MKCLIIGLINSRFSWKSVSSFFYQRYVLSFFKLLIWPKSIALNISSVPLALAKYLRIEGNFRIASFLLLETRNNEKTLILILL